MSMITDIHAHVLPGIDDGPESLNESHQLLRRFEEFGVDRVFCTPHVFSPHFEVDVWNTLSVFETLSMQHGSRQPLLALGAEVRLSSELLAAIRNDKIPTLGRSRYVLVEFQSNHISAQALGLIHELRVRNFIPIMAHPERNIEIQKDQNLLTALLDEGLIFQLTAGCFLKAGRDAHTADKLAWKVLESGFASVIASDAHNADTRFPNLTQAYDNIASRCGQETVDQLMNNANAIWDNTEVEPVTFTRRRRLTTIFNRL